jgi:hypothetical protein
MPLPVASTPTMSAPFVRFCPSFLLLPAMGNQAAFQNTSAQNAR